MQRHLRLSLAALALSACIGSNAPSEPAPFEIDEPGHTIQYLRAGHFIDRIARVSSGTPFRGVGIVAEMPDPALLEFRLHAADGSVGPWQALVPEWREGGYRTVVLALDAPTDAIELRSDLAPSFVRVELSPTEELLGAHEGVLDDDTTPRAARPGIWQPPASTLAVGDTQSIPYVGATGCSSTQSLLPGTRDIADMLRASFPGATSYGGYNCRKIAGTNSWSVHATGRAIDLFVTPVGGQADNDGGDPIGNWLIEHSEYVGISFVIWDRASWGAHRPAGAKHKTYGGEHPHHDHLHIEVSQTAASRGTQWFADGKPRPGTAACRPKAVLSCATELLQPGRVLNRGDIVESCDKRFFLTMQTDGNLVLYQRKVGALWSSLTYNSNADRAVMQTDGNLVVYRGSTAVWSSNTYAPGAIGAVQSDGNFVVYKSTTPIWASYTAARPTPDCTTAWLGAGQLLSAGQSRTSCDGRFTLVMQADGNLVLYQLGVGAVWNAATTGTGATFAAMQEDGNLVVYAGAQAVWATHTNRAGSSLAIQSDGNLVVYGGGQALWSSASAECP